MTDFPRWLELWAMAHVLAGWHFDTTGQVPPFLNKILQAETTEDLRLHKRYFRNPLRAQRLKYRPDQLREPQGSPIGGQFADEGRGTSRRLLRVADKPPKPLKPLKPYRPIQPIVEPQQEIDDPPIKPVYPLESLAVLTPVGRVARAIQNVIEALNRFDTPEWKLGNFKSQTKWAN